MKRKLLFVGIAVALASIMAFGTLAYYTDTDSAHNEMLLGNLDIELLEWADKPAEGDPVPFPQDGITGIAPGTEVTKIAEVRNIGESTVWLRVSVEKAVILAEGVEATEPVNTDLITLDFNTEAWEFNNGFYYYKTPLAPGETTEPLFTNVAFASDMGNMYQQATAEISVHAYAVQYANNGETFPEAQGWPAVEP